MTKLSESKTLLLVGTGLVTVYVALRTRRHASRIGQKVVYKIYRPLQGFFRKVVLPPSRGKRFPALTPSAPLG